MHIKLFCVLLWAGLPAYIHIAVIIILKYYLHCGTICFRSDAPIYTIILAAVINIVSLALCINSYLSHKYERYLLLGNILQSLLVIVYSLLITHFSILFWISSIAISVANIFLLGIVALLENRNHSADYRNI